MINERYVYNPELYSILKWYSSIGHLSLNNKTCNKNCCIKDLVSCYFICKNENLLHKKLYIITKLLREKEVRYIANTIIGYRLGGLGIVITNISKAVEIP